MKSSSRRAEIRDLAPGLWIWRAQHPGWILDADWQRVVTSTYVESRGEALVLDPLAPPPDAVEVWKRLDERPPTAALVLLPDHVRDIDLLVRLYGPVRMVPCSSSPTMSQNPDWNESTATQSFPED